MQNAGAVHRVTGCCPSVAVQVLWAFPNGKADVPADMKCAVENGVRIGAINPNVYRETYCYVCRRHHLSGDGPRAASISTTAATPMTTSLWAAWIPTRCFASSHEIFDITWETGQAPDIAYMVDQSHNLKNKIEETIQTSNNAQVLFAKAALVDRERLAACQKKGEILDAEETLREAFFADVRPRPREWRRSKGLPEDPIATFCESGVCHERQKRERNA